MIEQRGEMVARLARDFIDPPPPPPPQAKVSAQEAAAP
jgi:hypothetical protein